jgi:hypothetical protein
MGASDGHVIGLTKIHDSGPPDQRFNLVLIAEGFTDTQQQLFQTRAREFTDFFFSQAPFDDEQVACAINVYRLDVVSNEEGADSPACGNEPEGPTPDVATYFDATLCPGGVIARTIGGNDILVIQTVLAVLPEATEMLVIVNHADRHGTGGLIGWTTTGGANWKEVALHEMAHVSFALADEYDCLSCEQGETGHDHFTDPEPLEPNVSIEPDPALVKWSTLVTAGPDVPTMPNPDCSERNLGPSPVPAGTVGTFEGARYFHCDVFRPAYACRMRDSDDPFCPVCQQAIRDTIGAYSAPSVTGDITLDTLSVAFDDVPEGTWTVRPVQFSVDTCFPVTFEVTAMPALPFTVPYDALVVSEPNGSHVRTARLWVMFMAGAAGSSANSSITVRLVDRNESWTIPLSANAVARPQPAVQLVFDRSGSMLDMTIEGRLKKDVLKDAAHVFADIVYEGAGIGANAYDQDPHPLMEIEDAGPLVNGAGRTALRAAIDAYEPNPNGATAIGDGIELAREKLDAATGYDSRAMIVLTDGIETASKRVADVADAVVNERVYAIGLGTADQIQPATLAALTDGTGGYLLMTGQLSVDDTFLLDKYYLQILAGVTNNDIVVDPEGWLSSTANVRVPFDVNEGDIEITAITLATATDAVDMALETPAGDLIGAAQAAANPPIAFARSPRSIFGRASLPVVTATGQAREGRWHVVLSRNAQEFRRYLASLEPGSRERRRAEAHGIKYSVNVHTYSNLRLAVRLAQSSREPGATLDLEAVLTEYGGPFRGSATAMADVTHPSGTTNTVALDAKGGGAFGLTMTAHYPGLYRFRTRAHGTSARGQAFTREAWRTGAVWIGGDRPPERVSGDDRPDLRAFLCCLVQSGAFTPKLAARLAAQGVDVDRLARCLERLCGRPPRPGARPPRARPARASTAGRRRRS